MATYNGIKKIKIGDNIFNLYDSGNSGGTITQVKTTAGAHTAITVTSGAANFNVPTTAAHVSAVPLSASSTTISSDALRIQNNQSSKTSQAGSNPYVTTVMLGDGRECTIDEYGDGYLAIHGKYGIFLHPQSNDIKVYDATSTYAVGDIVWYDRKYYRCTTAIPTAEAWTSGHWSNISATSGIIKVMGGIHPAVSEVYNLGSSDLKWKVLYAKFINGVTQINDVQIPSLTAQTTQAIYPIAINAIGQITGYGAALTSKVEISGGTDVSLVTQGEKYTWNHKQNALTNPVTGTGTSGYLAKFNGTSSITSGPQLGNGTTTYLRNDGSWATPAYPVTSVNTKTGAVSLTASDIGINFGYTTSGNNRAVQQDSSGNLYVVQKDNDANVKSTTVTAETTYYLTGSTTSTTNTAGLSKHASASISVIADSSTAGATTLTLGNSIASGTAGSKRGVIKLYGINNKSSFLYSNVTTASHSNYLPDKDGTLAVTDDIPTKTSHLTNDSGFLTAVPASGVTAGTYDGGTTKDSGFYVPSFTVDSTGRITSATDLGILIPELGTSNETSPYTGCVVTPWRFSQTLRNFASYTTSYVLSAGSTSKTITISADSYSGYSHKTTFRVADVQCYDVSTFEPILVDWSTSPYIDSRGSSLTLTVSIASAHINDICIFPILTQAGTTGGK